MTDDYKRGLVTGLAMQPLYVGTGGGDVSISFDRTKNLLAGCTFNSNICDTTVEKSGIVKVNIKADIAAASWLMLVNDTLTLKLNTAYLLAADVWNGYGRIGISNISGSAPWRQVGRNASGFLGYLGAIYGPWVDTGVAHGDNELLEQKHTTSMFYINAASVSQTANTQAAWLWFCGDITHNDARAAHTVRMALYEQSNVDINFKV